LIARVTSKSAPPRNAARATGTPAKNIKHDGFRILARRDSTPALDR